MGESIIYANYKQVHHQLHLTKLSSEAVCQIGIYAFVPGWSYDHDVTITDTKIIRGHDEKSNYYPLIV